MAESGNRDLTALAATLMAAAVLWPLILFAAPLAVSRQALTIPTFVVYQAGSRICHQRPERSFSVAGAQMPVCARCLGLYIAAAVGSLLAIGLRRQHDLIRVALLLSAVPILLSVGLERSGVYEGTNLLRFLSALPFGAVASWALIGTALSPTRVVVGIVP